MYAVIKTTSWKFLSLLKKYLYVNMQRKEKVCEALPCRWSTSGWCMSHDNFPGPKSLIVDENDDGISLFNVCEPLVNYEAGQPEI